MTAKTIDTESFSAYLRSKAIDREGRKILFTRFSGSNQEKDLSSLPNCGGFGRIHHFMRTQGGAWPSNPLPIDPASHFLNLPMADSLSAQVFQNGVCSWRCWYCFVDFDLLSANRKYSEFKSVDQLLDLYLREADRPQVIDLSGGQPDLVPEWSLWFSDLLHERGLQNEIYLWTDDNLSNDYLWKYLTPDECRRLASSKNYGRVGCFKGFDENSFTFNTNAHPDLFLNQFTLMKRLVDAEFDVYGYATFTTDKSEAIRSAVTRFVDLLQEKVHPIFPLRVVPLKILSFTPTQPRITPAHQRSMAIQYEVVACWIEELQSRFAPEIRDKKVYAHKLF